MNPKYMQRALSLAEQAFAEGEIPVGAVLVCNDEIVCEAYNTREKNKHPFYHAEMQVLEQASLKKSDWRLSDCDLYVTLEPCLMCLGALFQTRVKTLVFGAHDPKRENESFVPSLQHNLQNENLVTLSLHNHNLQIYGDVMAEDCSNLLKKFFQKRRV